MEPIKVAEREADAMRSVLARTNCNRVAQNSTAAVCRYPVGGLPRKDWCDTCIATKALEPEEAV